MKAVGHSFAFPSYVKAFMSKSLVCVGIMVGNILLLQLSVARQYGPLDDLHET